MQKQLIDDFLAQKQVAIAGVSRDKAKFSNKVFEKLREAGYGLSVVHPEAESIDGVKCVPSVRELPTDVNTLMVVASPKVCANVLKDVIQISRAFGSSVALGAALLSTLRSSAFLPLALA